MKPLTFKEIENIGMNALLKKFKPENFPKEFFFTIFENLVAHTHLFFPESEYKPATEMVATFLSSSNFPKKDFFEIEKSFLKNSIKSANFHLIHMYYNKYGISEEGQDFILSQPELIEMLECFAENSILELIYDQ